MELNQSFPLKPVGRVSYAERDLKASHQKLFSWLQRKYPQLTDRAINGVTMLGDATPGTAPAADVPWYQQIANTVAAAIPAYAQYRTQKELIKLNIERAKQGLDPVDSSAQVKVGINDDSKKFIYLGMGLVALIAVVALTRRK